MREVVIVISDLYPAAAEAEVAHAGKLPALEHVVRFGRQSVLPRGWRSWIAQWAGREDLADAAPASVAAAALDGLDRTGVAWLATPVHLIAGLTSVHMSARGLLRLPGVSLERLAADFAQTFGDSGYRLLPLRSGELLAIGPATEAVQTVDPARYLGASVEPALPSGPGAASLRRLGAELEMWLHEHPVNLERERRGELRVSTLWLWGGGPSSVPLQKQLDIDASKKHSGVRQNVAYGRESFVQGLWRLLGGEAYVLPGNVDAVLDASAERALVVVEALDPNESGTLDSIDDRWIHPMLDALRRGAVRQLTLVANDRRFVLRSHDRLKLWRRSRAALAGLQ